MTDARRGGPDDRASARSPAGDALTELLLRVFRLNGLFLGAAERMARPAGLTPARWQVLGAVLQAPLTVSGIARRMGLARQSVQRLADVLVAEGILEYQPNPAHRRAKLVAPTAKGWAAIEVLRPLQYAWANRVTRDVPGDEIERAVALMDRLIEEMDGRGPLR